MSNKTCEICGSLIHKFSNWCDNIDCHIELTKRAGGVVYTPNNLPIKCFRHDGLMLEHEHGDHPDYIFPVDIEYIGSIDDRYREDYRQVTGINEFSDEDVRKYMVETHALLYANYSVAVTMYETGTYMWSLQKHEQLSECGKEVVVSISGASLVEPTLWKISNESLKKITVYEINKQLQHRQKINNLWNK